MNNGYVKNVSAKHLMIGVSVDDGGYHGPVEKLELTAEKTHVSITLENGSQLFRALDEEIGTWVAVHW